MGAKRYLVKGKVAVSYAVEVEISGPDMELIEEELAWMDEKQQLAREQGKAVVFEDHPLMSKLHSEAMAKVVQVDGSNYTVRNWTGEYCWGVDSEEEVKGD